MLSMAYTMNPWKESRMVDPLHGKSLENIVTTLVDHFGFKELGNRIKIKCFTSDPSVKSSLKFLRKTPWARAKVEALYVKNKEAIESS